MTINIPKKPQRHFRKKDVLIKHEKPFRYIAGNGEPIDVLTWVRWPSYDFIFGVPAKKNKYRKEEKCFFQYRDTRMKKVISGFYVDEEELKTLVDGFTRIQNYWKQKDS